MQSAPTRRTKFAAFTLLLVTSGCSFTIPDSTRTASRSTARESAAVNEAPGPSSRDLLTCRRAADRSMGADDFIDPADDHTNNPMVLARREELRGTYQTLVDQCMGNPR